jgi:hypothetical protein
MTKTEERNKGIAFIVVFGIIGLIFACAASVIVLSKNPNGLYFAVCVVLCAVFIILALALGIPKFQ